MATRSAQRGLRGRGEGSTGGGLLGFYRIPGGQKQWPRWAGACWGPAVWFLGCSAGPGDARGTAELVLCRGQPAWYHAAANTDAVSWVLEELEE